MEGKSTRLALANGRLELEKELICGGIINLPIVVFWKANCINDFTLVNKYSSNKSPNILFPRNTVPRGVKNALGTVFQSNSIIRKFHEFQHFRLSSLESDAFNSSGIAEITFPTTLRTISGTVFRACYNLTSMILNEGVTTTGQQWLWGCRNIVLIDLPSTIKTLTGYGIHTYDSRKEVNYKVICRAVTPPSLGSNSYLPKLTAVYVPDESVDAYKAASVWSGIAAKIKPMSEYTGS